MMSYEGKERRHRRKIYVSAFAYRLPSRSSEVFFGVTSNISDSGMCIYSDARPDEGESMEFRSALPIPYPKATVKWVKDDVGGIYRMGLMFDE